MEQSYLTLPTVQQLGHRPHLVSDFAIALGAICSYENYEVNGQVGKSGVAWTCQSAGTQIPGEFQASADRVCTVDCQGLLSSALAGCQRNCIMPRIVNPEAMGFDTVKSEDGQQEFLTLQGEVVTYPKTAITDPELDRALHLARTHREGTITRQGDHVVNGNHVSYNEEVGENSYCSKMSVERFEFQGQSYAFLPVSHQGTANDSKFRDGTELLDGRGYYFACEPVAVNREADGCIQVQEMMLPMQYETQSEYRKNHATDEFGRLQNLADYNIGQYMNRALMREFHQSVGLELDQTAQQETTREI